MRKNIYTITKIGKKTVALILVGYMLPVVTFAQGMGLIPCAGTECKLSDLGVLMNTIIDFLMKITIPLAAIAFAVGGVFMIFAPASESNIAKGKEIMKATIYGIFIVFLAWIIVKTVLVAVGFDAGISWINLGG